MQANTGSEQLIYSILKVFSIKNLKETNFLWLHDNRLILNEVLNHPSEKSAIKSS
jgi:hypothetical protein